MGLYKRKGSNIWQMCFFVNGQKIRMSTKTSNKKVAQRIYEKARVDSVEGKQLTGGKGKIPFDRLVDEFIEKHCKVEKVRYGSDIRYGKMFKEYFKQTPIGKITSYDIKSWRQTRIDDVTYRGTVIKKASVNREIAFLKTMFNMAVDWEWLSESPCARIKMLKGEEKRQRYLTREEISRLIASADSYFRPIIVMAVSTGMRRSEIFQLKWKDVDFERGFIVVEKSKNHESREIPMDEFVSETLRSLEKSRELSSYVFCRRNGERYRDLTWVFRRAARRAGIEDLRFHDLRHTAASMLASGGCDIITLKNVLGHKSLAMTQRYAHFMPDQHEKTRRIMKNIWVNECDTEIIAPVLVEGSGSARNRCQQMVLGNSSDMY